MRALRTARCALIAAALAGACVAAGDDRRPRGLTAQLAESARVFFDEAGGHGVRAQSRFALFVREGSIAPRHLEKFRRALESAVRSATADKSVQLMTSSDRVFFLSDVQPPSWKTKAVTRDEALVLVRAFRNGTHEGWVAFHDFWSQFNRLAVGDSKWIGSLPASIRADLSHPLEYVLRVDVVLEESPGLAEFVHDLNLQMVEVGSEKVIYARSFPLVLTYPIP